MSRTSKLLLGVLASMMVCSWPLIGADELDPTKQEDHAGFGPAARQVMALQPVEARCRAETDAAVAVAVVAVANTAAADALDAAVKTAAAVAAAVEGVWLEVRALAKTAKHVADCAACSTQPTRVD